jgi:hypothetical protein
MPSGGRDKQYERFNVEKSGDRQMAREKQETIEDLKARLAQDAVDQQAEIDKKLEAFDRETAARKAKVEVAKAVEQRAKEEAQQQAAEARFEREHVAPMKRAWLAAGGSEQEFEAALPQLRKEKLAQLSLGQTTVQEQWRRSAARRYR